MALPTFLLIGAPKAGSTTLYHLLGQHPEVFVSPLKEPRFFAYLAKREALGSEPPNPAFFPVRTWEAYHALFEPASAGVRGEASVSYLEFPGVAAVVHRHLPDVRLVAILRDPVARAHSHYLMGVRSGKERGSFEAAIRAGRYLAGGFYARNLEPWYARFGADRLFVCLQEDLRRDASGLIRRLYAFLGVDETFVPDPSFEHNVGGAPRSRLVNYFLTRRGVNEAARRLLPDPVVRRLIAVKRLNYADAPLSDQDRALLAETYRADVEALSALLGRDLTHWLRTDAGVASAG